MKTAMQTRQYGSPPWGNPMSSPYWRLAMVPPEYWDAPRFEACYTTQFLPLNGGSTMVDQFNVPDYGAFIIYGVSAEAVVPTNPPSLRWGSGLGAGFPSRVLIQITDSLLDYKFFSKAVPLDNIVCGAGGQSPFLPYVCQPNTTITVQMTSLNLAGVSEDWNWSLNFTGAQLFGGAKEVAA